jgi:hypothetical protein
MIPPFSLQLRIFFAANLDEFYPYLRQRKEEFSTILYPGGNGHKSSSHPADG